MTLSKSFLLGLALTASACSDGPADEPEPMPDHRTVEATPVQRSGAPMPIRTSGTLSQASEQTLSFKIGGIVRRMAVEEGDQVQAGQVMATLDLREIDAAVAQARAGAEKADRDLARAERLQADSVATRTQVRDAQTAAEVARASLASADFNRQYAVVRAPEAGRVLDRSAEPNELVTAGQPIFRIGTAAGGWVVRASVPDRDIVRIQPGDRASVQFGAFSGETFVGRVVEVGHAASGPGGTFEIEVSVDDPEERLRSGFVASVEVQPQGTGDLLVPASALIEADGSVGVVMELDGDVARRRTVELAGMTGGRLAVRSGLRPGARVVTSGAPFLADGDTVVVTRAEPLASAAR